MGAKQSTRRCRWKFNLGSQRWTREPKPLAPSLSVGDDRAWWEEFEQSVKQEVSVTELARFALYVVPETFNYGGDELEDEGDAKRTKRSLPEDDADAEDEWWLEVDSPR